jgi:hypothetical protein
MAHFKPEWQWKEPIKIDVNAINLRFYLKIKITSTKLVYLYVISFRMTYKLISILKSIQKC